MYRKTLLALFTISSIQAVNVNLLSHSHSPVYMQTEDTLEKDSLPNETLIFSGYYNYVEDPFISTDKERTERKSTIIEGINALHLGAGYQSSSRFLIGFSTFAAQVWLPTREGRYALGDSKLIGKYRVSGNNSPVSFALIPELELPTGNSEYYLSNETFGLGLKGAVEYDFGLFKVNGNLGFSFNNGAEYKGLDYRQKMLMAIGVHMPLGDSWGLTAEATTTRTLPFNKYQNPGEVYFGGRYKLNRNISFDGGASVGNLNNFGSNEFRLLFGVKYIPVLKNGPYQIKHFFTKKEKEFIKKILEINDEIRFAHDSSELTSDSKIALEKMAALFKDETRSFNKVIIEGHANRIGTEEYNKDLSLRRSDEVRKYLISQGVDESYLSSVGFGEQVPKSIEDWSEAKHLNRRVEFKVIQ